MLLASAAPVRSQAGTEVGVTLTILQNAYLQYSELDHQEGWRLTARLSPGGWVEVDRNEAVGK